MNTNDDQFINKIKKAIPDEENRILLIATLLGTGGCLIEFIMQNCDPSRLPVAVRYACSITAGNLMAFISDDDDIKAIDMTKEHYVMSEQTQETIYRKMKWIVEKLYESIHKNEE